MDFAMAKTILIANQLAATAIMFNGYRKTGRRFFLFAAGGSTVIAFQMIHLVLVESFEFGVKGYLVYMLTWVVIGAVIAMIAKRRGWVGKH